MADMAQTAILGAGVMGETLLSGLVRAGRRVDQLLVGEKRPERARELEERYGVAVVSQRRGGAARPTPSPSWSSRRTWATCSTRSPPSCAPASWWSRWPPASPPPSSSRGCPTGVAVVRVMPNTPALVDEGMAAISPGSHCDEEHLAEAEALMASTGKVLRIPERQHGRRHRDLRLRAGVHLLRRRVDDRGRRPPRPAARHRHRAGRPDRSSARPRCSARPAPTRPCCASRSPRPAAPPPRRCASWRSTRCARRSSPRWRPRATARAQLAEGS